MKLRHLWVLSVLVVVAALAAPLAPDPTVARFEFAIHRDKYHSARGTARIIAVVKNIGSVPYNTHPGQQLVNIYELPNTTTPKKMCDFGTLFVNAEYRCEFDRPWNSNSPAEGAMPPTYRAMIVYDPDILGDGNPKNDDRDMHNNRLEASGAPINLEFHRR